MTVRRKSTRHPRANQVSYNFRVPHRRLAANLPRMGATRDLIGRIPAARIKGFRIGCDF